MSHGAVQSLLGEREARVEAVCDLIDVVAQQGEGVLELAAVRD